MSNALPYARELAAALAKGELVMFVGAGLSVGAGAPSWHELVEGLRAELVPPTGETDPTVVAQFFRNQHGANALVRRIRDVVQRSSLRPTRAHRVLCSLSANVIVTTNYDDLVERSLRGADRPVHVIHNDQERALWNDSGEVQVLKVHGHIDDAMSIVITDDDYSRFLHTNVGIQRKLLELFAYRTICFVGYSLRDRDIAHIFSRVCFEQDCLKRQAYVLCLERDEHSWREWHRRHIIPVLVPIGDSSKTDAIADALLTIAAEADALMHPDRCDVLVVEDDEDQRSMIQAVLLNIAPRARVLLAGDGLEASILLGTTRPRVLWLDLSMPRLDGRKLLSLVRQNPRFGDMKIIVASAYIGSEAEAVQMGADAALLKPFDLHAIEPMLRPWLPYSAFSPVL
jgi:CheY-like chemotaxis protein